MTGQVRRVSENAQIIVWLISFIFGGGMLYAKIQENTRTLEDRTAIIEVVRNVQSEQRMMKQRFDYQSKYQEDLLNTIQKIAESMNEIKREVANTSKNTEMNTFKLESIKDSVEKSK